MTKEEVLQRANDYCNERSYDGETLTDEFKDKFAEHFAKRHESAGIDDEGIDDEIKFNLDTACSAAAKGLTKKQQTFESKENDYKKQIDELNAKLGKQEPPKTPPVVTIPKEVQDRLDELEKYKANELKAEKKKAVIKLAKEGIRQDLHASFDTYTSDFEATLDAEDKEQAKKLVDKFQAIFKDSIGDIKPLAPRQVQKRDEEYLDGMPKVTIE